MGLSPYMQYFRIGSTMKNIPSREMPTLLVQKNPSRLLKSRNRIQTVQFVNISDCFK